MKNKTMMTTIALGAAYLMRSKKTRDKLINQFKNFKNSRTGKQSMKENRPATN
ncbi:hypothetical protein [Mesobacillus harenae]|uniref:hypothetical protein n=1 Tax=Mesobacillus harenae TaxID=2213203 RepID=UPI00158110C5|nr:hypothetical protein [Mesobacillus harenae]